jgi:hypothetical protein
MRRGFENMRISERETDRERDDDDDEKTYV